MKTGVCSYCFNALINAGELTLFDAIEFVGEQTEAECFEPLSRYWDPQQDEIEQAREARSIADKTGLTFSCHALDSDFAVYDQAANRAAIDLCIRRLETTRILGANTVRLDPRTSLPKDSEEPDVDDILERIAHSMAEIADAAATMDIRVGVENHGRLLGRTSQTAHLVELVNRKNFGVNIDFTNFKVVFGEDHIEATRKLAKHVVHAHAKDFLLRQISPEGESWYQNPSGDYVKNTVGGEGDAQWSTLFKILPDAGYGGTVSLEVTDPADIKGSVIQGVANLKRILAEVKNS